MSWSPPKATWSELFFDLALIGAFLAFGSDFSKEKSVSAGIELAMKLLLIVWSWEQVALFVNRFGDPFAPDEPRSPAIHALRFSALLLLVSVIALSVTEASFPEAAVALNDALSYAGAATVLSVALIYEFGGLWRPNFRALANHRRNAALIAAVLFLLSAPTTGAVSVVMWIAGLVVAILGTLGPGLGRTLREFPINADHFAERLALFVLILIGEVFVKTVVTSHAVDDSATNILQLGFVAVVCWMVWVIYQREVLEPGMPERAGGLRGWSAGHYLFAFTMLVASVGLVWYVVPDPAAPVGDWIAFVASGGIGLAIASIAIIRAARGGPGAGKAVGRIAVIAAAAMAIGALAWLATPSNWRVGVGTLAVALVLLNAWRERSAAARAGSP